MPKVKLKQLDPVGASDGQVITYDSALGVYTPKDSTGGSCGGVAGCHAETITVWTLDGGRYRADITHNLHTKDVMVQGFLTSSSLTIGFDEIERISNDVVRVWVATQENIRVLVMTASPERYVGTASSWTLSGGLYYCDITHNLGSTDVMVTTYLTADSKTVGMEEIERTDSNTVRIWSATNTDTIKVLVFKC